MRKDAKGVEEEDDDEGSLKDFICDEDEDSDIKDTDDEDSDIQEVDEDGFGVQAKKRATRADKAEDLVALEDMEIGKVPGGGGWWNQFLDEEQNLDDITFGSKMVLLMDILKESAMIGDKVTDLHPEYGLTIVSSSGACVQPVHSFIGSDRGIPGEGERRSRVCKGERLSLVRLLGHLDPRQGLLQDGRLDTRGHEEDLVQVLQQGDQPQDAPLPHLHQGRRARDQPGGGQPRHHL